MIVVDANIALSWVLEAEGGAFDYAQTVAREGVAGRALIAPAVLRAECGYVLLKKGRAGKWGAVKIAEFAEVIEAFNVQLYESDATLPEHVRFALRHNVSGFDAYYLALAMRAGAAIATQDKGLIAAAKAAGVSPF